MPEKQNTYVLKYICMTIWRKESCSSVCCISSRWGIIRILVTSHVKGFTYKTMIMKVFWKRWFTITCAGTILFYRVNQSTILTLTWRWWETSREPSSWSSDSSGVSGTRSINGCTIYTTSSAGRGRGHALPQVCPVCSSTRTRSMTTL